MQATIRSIPEDYAEFETLAAARKRPKDVCALLRRMQLRTSTFWTRPTARSPSHGRTAGRSSAAVTPLAAQTRWMPSCESSRTGHSPLQKGDNNGTF